VTSDHSRTPVRITGAIQATEVFLKKRRNASNPVMPIPRRASDAGSGTPLVATLKAKPVNDTPEGTNEGVALAVVIALSVIVKTNGPNGPVLAEVRATWTSVDVKKLTVPPGAGDTKVRGDRAVRLDTPL